MPESQVKARVARRFRASAERVFESWINPAEIEKWFGPGLGEMVRVEVDARVGGSFSWVQRRGSQDIEHAGHYLEFERPRRLVFTWSAWALPKPPEPPDTARVLIDIVPLAEGCELTLTHELHPDWSDYKDRTESAWSMMLDAMTSQLESEA